VTSITGYTLYDTMEGLEADLLVVKAEPDGSLPKQYGLVVSGDSDAAAPGARRLKGAEPRTDQRERFGKYTDFFPRAAAPSICVIRRH
jgi:hypothetical protein